MIENGFLSYLTSQKQKVEITHKIKLTDKTYGPVSASTVYTFDYSITEENGLTFKLTTKPYGSLFSGFTEYTYEDGYLHKGNKKEPLSAVEAAELLGEYLGTTYIDMNSITDFTIKREDKKVVVDFTATDEYMQGMLDMIAEFYEVDYINATIKSCSMVATFDNDFTLCSVDYRIQGTNVDVLVMLSVQ